MPSPFPGMDPYLEHPRVWRGFHTKFLSEMQTILTAQLAPEYLVNIEERVFVSDSRDDDLTGYASRVPDVLMTSPSGRPSRKSATVPAGIREPVVVMDWEADELSECFLTVYDSEEREAITVIELLSPTNKTVGTHGREEYQAKRRSIIGSQTHLVEIDLLRSGQPVTDRKATEYCVTSSVARLRPKLLLWPIALDEPLPLITIPLRDKRMHPFDLQQAFNVTYDRGGYQWNLDYSQPPMPALATKWRPWAAKLLKARR